MKEIHRKLVKEIIDIINKEIRNEKTTGYIKDVVYYHLIDAKIGIKDLDYFDRSYVSDE